MNDGSGKIGQNEWSKKYQKAKHCWGDQWAPSCALKFEYIHGLSSLFKADRSVCATRQISCQNYVLPQHDSMTNSSRRQFFSSFFVRHKRSQSFNKSHDVSCRSGMTKKDLFQLFFAELVLTFGSLHLNNSLIVYSPALEYFKYNMKGVHRRPQRTRF